MSVNFTEPSIQSTPHGRIPPHLEQIRLSTWVTAQRSGSRLTMWGAALLIIGGLIALATYLSAGPGNTYYRMYGAIGVGLLA